MPRPNQRWVVGGDDPGGDLAQVVGKAAFLLEALAEGAGFEGVAEALRVEGADVRLFGKPESFERRRMGVALARDINVTKARAKARKAAKSVQITKR